MAELWNVDLIKFSKNWLAPQTTLSLLDPILPAIILRMVDSCLFPLYSQVQPKFASCKPKGWPSFVYAYAFFALISCLFLALIPCFMFKSHNVHKGETDLCLTSPGPALVQHLLFGISKHACPQVALPHGLQLIVWCCRPHIYMFPVSVILKMTYCRTRRQNAITSSNMADGMLVKLSGWFMVWCKGTSTWLLKCRTFG